MRATVAICTLNRAESLRRTLDSLTAMHIPNDLLWEIVVVNNGCTDHTDKIIASFARQLPIRREAEPQRGVSRARNRIVDTAKGEYIVWTDDDVVVGPGWLAAYAEAFRRWPAAAVFGGPIIPRYETPTAAWLRECEHMLHMTYAVRDLGDAPFRLSEGCYPFGANFTVRAAEQRRCRYDINLGMAPGRGRLGEETSVIRRILATGAIGYWVPDARVEHCIGCERQTTAYIAHYFAAHAETNAVIRGSPRTGPLYFGVPRWMWRQLAESWLRYHLHRVISPAPVWMEHLKNYGCVKGDFRYWWNQGAAGRPSVKSSAE
jgi:glycosyltransferase involved in cell wall biosynthesis